ncbi:MAG: tRNA (adenosine(37)-N6)-threonylcarbamoyltransferase complex ATPase subunit type 1 TsaE [Candidatus Peregrinibacteria bacterium]|nr:tRNA (adenosine(37)-N6)-threonylcarbamoyltransferase complex ATPase subunit type 1 TsaE [Candidatus Peregrinibacteria bacterium]
MSDFVTIWLPDAQSTASAGASLRNSLFGPESTILLSGELGAGKTTFLQGFLRSLGVSTAVISPTYALEQRYETPRGIVSHIDLYRLNEKDAVTLLRETEGTQSIRCIEWPERVDEEMWRTIPAIHIHLKDSAKDGRDLRCAFRDIPLPSTEQIVQWREDVLLPEHIRRHCDAVAAFAQRLASLLLERGILVRSLALARGGEVHDLLRFLDFRSGASPNGKEEYTEEQVRVWAQLKNRFGGLKHEAACAEFLRTHGFDALAEIVRVHGLVLPSPERTTIEQKLLFYADKRVQIDRVVSLDDRFADFLVRYGSGKQTKESDLWYAEARALEQELFPEGAPS